MYKCINLARFEPYVSDIILFSGSGRSSANFFFVGSATDWMYSHEFGHILGLKDYYREVWERNSEGGFTNKITPDIESYGQRAVDSIMGSRSSDKPTEGDLADILDPAMSKYELPARGKEVHHIDLSRDDISEAVEFFEKIAAARGVDISVQIDLLRTNRDPGKRQRIVDWIMRNLFDKGLK